MVYNPNWYKNDGVPVPTFQDLEDITGGAYNNEGLYIGPKEKKDMQLVIDNRTKRQYWAPAEYDEDIINYGIAKMQKDFNSKEWWGMVRDPHLTTGEKLASAWMGYVKTGGKALAKAGPELVAGVTAAVDAVGFDLGNILKATNPAYLASSVSRKGIKAAAQDYVDLLKNIKTPKGKTGPTAAFWQATAQNYSDTLDRWFPDVDENIRAHSTLVAIGEIAGQVSSSLLLSAGVNQMGGLKAVAGFFGTQQFYQIREEYLQKGYSLDSANIHAAAAGGIEAWWEKVGFGGLLKFATLKRSARNVLISGFIESAQEMAQTASEEALTNLTGAREETLVEILANIAISGAAGFVPGAGFSMAVGGANISTEKAEHDLNNAVKQEQAKKQTSPVKEGTTYLPGPTPKQELALAKANKGSNQIYEVVKNIANSYGVTDEKAIDAFYYFARNKAAMDQAGAELLNGLGSQIVAYKNQLTAPDKMSDKENKAAAEDIKWALSQEAADKYHEQIMKAQEEAGIDKQQAEIVAEQADKLYKNLSEQFGMDLQEFKAVKVTALPSRQNVQEQEAPAYSGEVPFQSENVDIRALQRQIDELDKMANRKPKSNLLSTLRKTGVDYSNTRLDPQTLKDLKIKNVPVSKGGLGGEAVDYLVKHGFMAGNEQMDVTTYEDGMQRMEQAEDMLERALSGEQVYRLDDQQMLAQAEEAQGYKEQLQEQLNEKLSEAGKRGYIKIGDTMNEIVLGKYSDVTTLQHELMHHWKNLIEILAAKGNKKAQALKAQMDKIIEENKEYVKQKENAEEEVLSEAYEAWLYSGVVAEDPQEQSLYEAIKQFFQDIYDSVQAITGIRINPEIDMFFRQMTGEMPIQMQNFTEGQEAETGMAYQAAAMYLSPHEDFAKFFKIAPTNEHKSYFAFKNKDGIEIHIPSDTLIHDEKHPEMNVEHWEDLMDSIDNITYAARETLKNRSKFNGVPILLSIDGKLSKYGVVLEIVPSNGRILLTTGFRGTEKGINAWIKNKKSAETLPPIIFDLQHTTSKEVAGSFNGRSSIYSIDKIVQFVKTLKGNRTFNQIAGPNAKTAASDKLEQAVKMDAEGESKRDIRNKTGWFKGADEKWRFEIKDGEINEDAVLEKNEIGETEDHGFLYYYTVKLGDLYKAPELYEAYPDLKDITVSFQDLDPEQYGSYHRGNSFFDESISLSSKYLTKDNPDFIKKIDKIKATKEYKKYDEAFTRKVEDGDYAKANKMQDEAMEEFYNTSVGKEYKELMWGKNPPVKREIEGLSKKAKKALIHEIQHAIQQREGFSNGASPKSFMNLKMRAEITQQIMDRKKEVVKQEFIKELEKKAGDKKLVRELIAEEKKANEVDGLYIEGKITREEAVRGEARFKELLSKVGITGAEYYQMRRNLEIKNGLDYWRQDAPYSPYDLYKMVAGEVEARNVEARADMTDEERAKSFPEDTQDIKNADALVVFGDGTELAYRPQEKILYQGDKDLIATHATKSYRVNEILKSGWVVAPSLAITKKGQNELNKGHFGDIVLVMNPNRLSFSRDNIYNRDIYSPRLPTPVYLSKEFGYMDQSEWKNYQRKWEENPEEFKKKYGGTFDEVIGDDKYIFEGFNERTGKRIYKKYTPDNLLSYIRKESLVGGESWHYGLSSFLAKMSQQMSDREELRKESKKLVNREEAQQKYDELQKKYGNLRYGEIKKYSKFSDIDDTDFDSFLKDNYEGHPEKAEEFLEVDKIPASLKKEMKDFVDEALALPRSYFEAKPMRNVPLTSFVYAITKKGTLTPEQIKKFESYGVEVKEVDSIRDFDFSSLDVGGGNDTNVAQVYFQTVRAQQTGSKAADEKPSKERISSDIEAIRNNGVEKYEPKSKVGRSLGDWGKHILLSVRQRAGAIDPKIRAFFDKLDYFQPNLEKKFASKANGFVKSYQKLTEAEKNEFDYYIYNQCHEELNKFLKEKGMEKDYQEVRNLLNFIYAVSNKAGIDMGFISEYFPTSMIDYAGFLDHLKGTDKWSYIQKALRQADPEGVWSDKEKAEAINKLLRGYRLDPVRGPKNAKERTILYKSPELMRFYEHSDVALIKYLQGMSQAIAINKAFGKGNGFNTDETIGAIVLDLIESGNITNKEEAEIRRLLKSRLSYGATPEFIAMVKNVGYLQTMNNITSAITQLGDLYAPFYKYSFGTALKSIFGKSEITKTDLGLDKIWEEFSDSSKTGIAVDKLFKAIGLEAMDSFGKNVAINASLINLREQAAKGDIELTNRLAYTFGKDAARVLADIKAGKITDDVKILIWADLADTQPIGRSGVPTGYLDNPHGRIFYQLKTFTLNQISLFYSDCLVNIQKGIRYGNKAQFLKGVRNSFKLLLLLTAGNAAADILKNLIMGRDIDISDTVVSNLLWNIGVSKYTFYKGKRDGYARALLSSYLQPPQLSIGDDIYMDVRKIATGKRELKDTQMVTYLPFGRAYYWWFGGGRTSEIEKAKKEKKAQRNRNRKKK